MKNSHIIVFALLTLVIVAIVYTQYKQQQYLDSLTKSLAGIKQDNDNYRQQTQALLADIKNVVDEPDPEPEPEEEREPIGYKYSKKDKA